MKEKNMNSLKFNELYQQKAQNEYLSQLLPEFGILIDPQLLSRTEENEPKPSINQGQLSEKVKELGLSPSRRIFGEVLDGMDVLDRIATIPIYSYTSLEGKGSLVNEFYGGSRDIFLGLGKALKDERAIDKRGSFLKKVEIITSGLVDKK